MERIALTYSFSFYISDYGIPHMGSENDEVDMEELRKKAREAIKKNKTVFDRLAEI